MLRRKPAWKLSKTASFQTIAGGEQAALPAGAPAVVDLDGVDDVEGLGRPFLLPAVPPGIIIIIGDVGDAEQRGLEPVETLAFVRPAEQPDQLQPREFHVAADEVALLLGELDQGEDDHVVGGGGQAVLLGTFDDPAAGDELLPPLVVDLVLELDALLAGSRPVGEHGDREFGEVHLVLADAKQLG